MSRDQPPPPVEELLQHTGFVRSLARGALGKDDLSEDIVQDAWVSAMERGPRHEKAARTWLYRVVRNRIASLKRREGVERKHLDREREAAGKRRVPAPSEILQREEARQRLVAALLKLEPVYREPLVLRYYEDLPPREIAKRLGLPVETVRTQLRRGVKQLRSTLDHDYGDRRTWVLAALPLTWLPKHGTPLIPTGVAGALTAKQLVAITAAVVVAGTAAFFALSPSSPVPGTQPSTIEHGAAETVPAPELTPPTHTTRDADDGATADATADAEASKLTLTIVDYAGEPVVGAQVRVSKRRNFGFEREALRGVTDAQGRFRMPRVAAGGPDMPTLDYVLRVEQPVTRDDLCNLEVERWAPTSATLTLDRGFVIAGETIDREGRGVPGTHVTLRAGGLRRTVVANRRGHFRAAGLPAGRWRTEVSWAGVTGTVRAKQHWVLDSGTRGARLEVDAGDTRHLVRIPDYDPRIIDHRPMPLRVTEFTGEVERTSQHQVHDDGTVWLIGLDPNKKYALWWGPDHLGRHGYAADIEIAHGETALPLRIGRELRIHVVPPPNWQGWPQIRVRGRGIDVFAEYDKPQTLRTQTEPGQGDVMVFVVMGLPDGEFDVTAHGRDWSGTGVVGAIRARPGVTPRMELKRR